MQRYRGFLICVLVFALGGCSWFRHGADEDVVKIAQQQLELQKDQYGDPKPVNLPIRINYTINHKPQVGHEMRIDFEFISEKAITQLRVGLTTSDGLKLNSSDVPEHYHDLKPRETFTKSVIVEPTAENEYYLNMYVVTQIGEDKLAKLIKIPIALGEASLAKKRGPEQ